MFDTSTLNFNSILNKFAAALHEASFHFLMNRWTDVSSDMKSMKSVKIKINRLKQRVCHRFLPIDQYNRYQSNPIYRFLSIYRFFRLTTPGPLSTSRGGYGSKGNTACCNCTATLPTKRQQAVLRRTFLTRFQWYYLRTDNFAYIIRVDIVNNTSSHGIINITWLWIILKPINRLF